MIIQNCYLKNTQFDFDSLIFQLKKKQTKNLDIILYVRKNFKQLFTFKLIYSKLLQFLPTFQFINTGNIIFQQKIIKSPLACLKQFKNQE